MLLKNDVVIYGKFLRQHFFENISLEEFSKQESNKINCYTKYLYMDLFERDLYPYLFGRTLIEQTGIKKNIIITYEVHVDDLVFKLDMTYVKALNSYYLFSFENDIDCIIDIDSLCLKRTGISCLEIFGNIPIPFFTVVKNIKDKAFSFRALDLILSKPDLQYIRDLISKGYKNINSKLYEIEEGDKNGCSICYESEESEKSDKYLKLGCGHIYHRDCIRECIKNFYLEPTSEYFKCPYCSTLFYHIEIL